MTPRTDRERIDGFIVPISMLSPELQEELRKRGIEKLRGSRSPVTKRIHTSSSGANSKVRPFAPSIDTVLAIPTSCIVDECTSALRGRRSLGSTSLTTGNPHCGFGQD
jgi:hypothetical protein